MFRRGLPCITQVLCRVLYVLAGSMGIPRHYIFGRAQEGALVPDDVPGSFTSVWVLGIRARQDARSSGLVSRSETELRGESSLP